MIREEYTINSKEMAIQVVNTKVDSIRHRNQKKTGIRIYKDGKIGIAGYLGEKGKEKAEKRAIEALQYNINYPVSPTESIKHEETVGQTIFTQKEFLDETEKYLSFIRDEFPQFIFSEKIKMSKDIILLENDHDLELKQIVECLYFILTFKIKGSLDIINGTFISVSTKYDFEKLKEYTSNLLTAHLNKIELPSEGKCPVVFFTSDEILHLKLSKELNGQIFGENASLFSQKRGEKLFSDKFSYLHLQDPQKNFTTFFDAEGTILPEKEFMFIENGVIKAPFTNKKIAQKYNFPLSANAYGSYNSVPSLAPFGMAFKSSGKTIKELLQGEKAILVMVAMGGDYTHDGSFATPVMDSYLFDGENLLGKLPEIQISSHMYDMFGKNFIGVSTDTIVPYNKNTFFATRMDVKKI